LSLHPKESKVVLFTVLTFENAKTDVKWSAKPCENSLSHFI